MCWELSHPCTSPRFPLPATYRFRTSHTGISLKYLSVSFLARLVGTTLYSPVTQPRSGKACVQVCPLSNLEPFIQNWLSLPHPLPTLLGCGSQKCVQQQPASWHL